MRKYLTILGAALLIGSAAPALAGGGWHGGGGGGGWHGGGGNWGGGGWHGGWHGGGGYYGYNNFGFLFGYPFFGYPSYGYSDYSYPYAYNYPYPYSDLGGYADAPVQQSAYNQYWYFCPDSNAYYPYVQHCASHWEPIPAQPPPDSGGR